MRTRFLRSTGIIAVEARLFGPADSVTLLLAVDSASSYTVVSSRAARTAGLSQLPSRSILTVTASGFVRVPQVQSSSLAALGVRQAPFSVIVYDLPKSVPFDGLLGLDFFANRKLLIDFTRDEIELD